MAVFIVISAGIAIPINQMFTTLIIVVNTLEH